MQADKILVVEDDEELAEWVLTYLESKGFFVMTTPKGQEAIEVIKNNPPDLVLLDGMLPDIDGIDVCRSVRHFYSGPILMLTARDEEIDEVLGLEVGADDYLVKPIRSRALLARIRNHLRRKNVEIESQSNQCNSRIALGSLCIDSEMRTVLLNETKIKVSSREFDLLWALANKAGEVVSRNDLITMFRGFEYDGFDRSIDLHVSRLRKKLNDSSGDPHRIKTIWGKGYLLVKENWQ